LPYGYTHALEIFWVRFVLNQQGNALHFYLLQNGSMCFTGKCTVRFVLCGLVGCYILILFGGYECFRGTSRLHRYVQPWRWRWYIALKHLYPPVSLDDATSCKTNIWIFVAMKISNLISYNLTLLYRIGLWWRHAVAWWLRHYATSREVAGSRPDEVNEFFQFA
jgi:hypothetical protein